MPISSQCPVCSNSDTQLFLDGDDYLSHSSVGSSRVKLAPGRILKCKTCGLAFRSLRPSPEELAGLYRDADDNVYEAEMPNRSRTGQKHRKIVERYRKQPGHMIDVGCASGAFLRVMADAGWKVIGVEPSPSQCARARAILGKDGEIQQNVLEHAELPSGVDLVSLWDVLEHVTDPVSFLTRCAGLLRKDGLLILNVPHIDSFMAKSLRARWPLLLAEHLNYFTLPSLRLCGTKVGLEVVASGSRPVWFSLGYVLYRLSQHGLPGIRAALALSKMSRLQAMSVPVWMGELYVVYRRT